MNFIKKIGFNKLIDMICFVILHRFYITLETNLFDQLTINQI
mgnify:CR=1 FL=1